MTANTRCPLCNYPNTGLFHSDSWREYHQCADCGLVFVPARFHLSAEEEKARYDLHENDPEDQGYRRFVGRMYDLLSPQLKPHSHGLDFGSGPGPALAMMFRDAGFNMTLFDPYYAPDPAALDKHYDFIVSTETVEHLSQPGTELDRVWTCLRSGGFLGIMTKRLTDPDHFAAWHYIRDETHICFFADKSFEYLANKWNAELSFTEKDIVVLRKPDKETR